MGKFSDDVEAFADKTKAQLMAIFRESCQRAVGEMQTPVGAGGNMRIDTGFLRASGVASVDEIQVREVSRPANWSTQPASTPDPAAGEVALVLAGMGEGQTFFFVYTADYARHREVRDGFVRLTAQRWTELVHEVAADLTARS